MENSRGQTAHTLTLDARARAVMTGVEDVECFNEEIAVITTCMGAVTVTGAGLKVAQLDIAAGRVTLEGRVDSLEYGAAKKTGLLGRLFR